MRPWYAAAASQQIRRGQSRERPSGWLSRDTLQREEQGTAKQNQRRMLETPDKGGDDRAPKESPTRLTPQAGTGMDYQTLPKALVHQMLQGCVL